jgi:nucleotide-binding universal stress UspA family protein
MSCAVRLLSRRQTRGWNTAIEQERLDSCGVVVVGVDGSPTSLRAAAYGIGLARRQSARVVFVYARPYPMTLPGLGPDLSDGVKQILDAQDEIEERLLAHLNEQAAAAGVDTAFVTDCGDPCRVLPATADRIRADAVIIGSSTSLFHRVAGSSLSGRLTRSRHWPVIIVP